MFMLLPPGRQGILGWGVAGRSFGRVRFDLLLQIDPSASALANATFTISCGDPQRNKNYRAALFGSKKSDPVEVRAAAHFALSQRATPTPVLSGELRTLRQVAARLQATVRQRTRLINQFHHLLALTFPELALLVKDISLGWVLELVPSLRSIRGDLAPNSQPAQPLAKHSPPHRHTRSASAVQAATCPVSGKDWLRPCAATRAATKESKR